MAHKIDQSTGRSAFISFQEPAWHGLGKTFDREITVVDALADAGVNFTVKKMPNIHRLPSGIEIISKDSFFTFREDTNAVLGTRLGRDYTVFQNNDALQIVDDLLKTKKCKIETVGAVEGGRKVFILLKLETGIKVGKKDYVNKYILLAISHDGSMAIVAMDTNVRVVCWNTLTAALAGAKPSHKIRHTSNAQARVKEAFEIMGLLEDNSKKQQNAFNAMRANTIDQKMFFNYISNIFMTAEEIQKINDGEKDVISTRKSNIFKGVIDFANIGVGQDLAMDNGKPNMWYAYNAVTGFLTSRKYKDADDRFSSLILGGSAEQIDRAGNLALNTGKIKPIRFDTTDKSLFLN